MPMPFDEIQSILLEKGKKAFFLSDAHLGAPDVSTGREREKKLVRLLNEIEADTQVLYLVGDMFDFWFEHKYSIPKGHVRLFGKLAEWADKGKEIHFFTGNHDMWTFGYFEEELGIQVHYRPIIQKINGQVFHIAHGDAMGPVPAPVKWMKKVFDSRVLQWFFARLHPNFSFWLANSFSGVSRENNRKMDTRFKGEDKEELIIYSRDLLQEQPIDYFVFGHRHLKLDLPLGKEARFITLGDWVTMFSYGVFDGEQFQLLDYSA
jgi:UDP-2,3-diacylglucosamine hydrolase